MTANAESSTRTPSHVNHTTRAYQALIIAVALGSFSSSFMRLSQESGVPSMVIAAGRLTLAFIVLTPLALRNYGPQIRRLTLRDWIMAGAAGFWLAAHFLAFIASIELTAIAVVHVFINTAPLMVAVLETVLLKAIIPRIVWAGLAIALIGGAIIGGSSVFVDSHEDDTPQALIETHDDDSASSPATGAGLAFLAAVTTAIYMVIGRQARRKVSALPYIWILSGAGAMTGWLALLVTGTPATGYALEGYFWIAMVTIVAQLGFHSGFNYAVGYLSATMIGVVTQSLSVTAGVVAFLLFAELPTAFEVVGGFVIIAGVVVAIIGRRSQTGGARGAPGQR